MQEDSYDESSSVKSSESSVLSESSESSETSESSEDEFRYEASMPDDKWLRKTGAYMQRHEDHHHDEYWVWESDQCGGIYQLCNSEWIDEFGKNTKKISERLWLLYNKMLDKEEDEANERMQMRIREINNAMKKELERIRRLKSRIIESVWMVKMINLIKLHHLHELDMEIKDIFSLVMFSEYQKIDVLGNSMLHNECG